MSESEHDNRDVWVDPDDAPELADVWFGRADVQENGRLMGRGRPRLAHPKQRVTLRLDEDVVSALRASGRGWQTQVNAVLRDFVARDAQERAER